MFVDLGTKFNFSTAYHPQTDAQTERVNQVLEDMLHMYVMDKPAKWESNPTVEKDPIQWLRFNGSKNHIYLNHLNKFTHPLQFIKK